MRYKGEYAAGSGEVSVPDKRRGVREKSALPGYLSPPDGFRVLQRNTVLGDDNWQLQVATSPLVEDRRREREECGSSVSSLGCQVNLASSYHEISC